MLIQRVPSLPIFPLLPKAPPRMGVDGIFIFKSEANPDLGGDLRLSIAESVQATALLWAPSRP